MDWFEEWFDSPLYEKLYMNRDEAEARRLLELLEQTLSLSHCATILDLACGRGRHSINLAEKGYLVTGIDLSKQAIKTARRKAKKDSIQKVDFKVRDMRNPLPQKFDAVLNLFTSFGYFLNDKENIRIIESVVQMLKPNSVFVLDFLNARKVRSDFVADEVGTLQNIDYRIERFIKNGAIYKDITFKKGKRQKKYSERVKLYDFDWFEQEMSKRNLVIDHVYGDYKGSDFEVETSPRMMIISHFAQE